MSGGSQIFFGAATPACWTVHRESSPFPHDNNPGHLFDQIRRFNAKFSFKYGPFFKNLIFIPMSESFGHLMRGEPEKQ